jgi:hypothetical protein
MSTQGYTIHRALYYSDGLMQRVIEVRLRQGLITQDDLRGVVGYYSAPYCATIGHRALVSLYDPVERAWMKPVRMLQVDCSQSVDRQRHEAEKLIEVGYETAVAAHFVGEGRTQARAWEEK